MLEAPRFRESGESSYPSWRVFPCRWPGWLGLILSGLIGFLIMHHPMIFSGLAQTQARGVDPRLINYLLEHSYRWIMQKPGHRQFWDVPFFYPARNVAALSDTLLTVAPAYWAWRSCGFLPDTAFQLWMFTASGLNYVFGFWLFRSGLRRSIGGSIAGAFLFAFGAPRINQLVHQQLLPQAYTVFLLWALCRVFAERPFSFRRSFLLWATAGLSLAAQFYAGFYLGWFLVLALLMAAFWGFLDARLRGALGAVLREDALAIAGAALLASAAIFPLLVHYLHAAAEVGMRRREEVVTSIPYWRTWIYLGPESWLWGFTGKWTLFSDIGLNLEQAQRVGIGPLTLAVCLVGLLQAWHEPAVRLAGLTGLSLLLAVTRFERAIWNGLTVGLLVVCVAEIWRSKPPPLSRTVLALLVCATALACFNAWSLALALFPAAALLLGSQFLSTRFRAVFQNFIPVVVLGFLCLTEYSHRLLTLEVAAGVALLVEARRLVTGKPASLRSLSCAGIVLVVGCWLFPSEIIYWRYAARLVPGGEAIRAVSRGLLLALLPAALGMACFFEQAPRSRRRALAAGALALVCILEQGVTTTTFDKSAKRALAAELARRVDRRCSTFYYSPYRPQAPINEYHLDAMWAQLDCGVPTINGYSGSSPPGWLPLYNAVVAISDDFDRLYRALRQWALIHKLEAGTICWIRDGPEEMAPLADARDPAGSPEPGPTGPRDSPP